MEFGSEALRFAFRLGKFGSIGLAGCREANATYWRQFITRTHQEKQSTATCGAMASETLNPLGDVKHYE